MLNSKVGDIIRYGGGSTALMQIEYISKNHGGYGDRFYGLHCLGGAHGAYASQCSEATAADIAQWQASAVSGKWKRREFKAQTSDIVGAYEDN